MSPTPIALIFGFGKNIGTGVAKAFSAKGYRIATVCRSSSTDSTSSGYLHIQGDLSDPTSIPGIFETVRKQIGEPSVVVYNGPSKPKHPKLNSKEKLTEHRRGKFPHEQARPSKHIVGRCNQRCEHQYAQHPRRSAGSRNFLCFSPAHGIEDLHLHGQHPQPADHSSPDELGYRKECHGAYSRECGNSLQGCWVQVSVLHKNQRK